MNEPQRSAQYLQKELPVRIAHRINGFRGLPFIVGCNPSIMAVHELYIRAFYLVSEFEPVSRVAKSGFISQQVLIYSSHRTYEPDRHADRGHAE